jgi:hypothetical protein
MNDPLPGAMHALGAEDGDSRLVRFVATDSIGASRRCNLLPMARPFHFVTQTAVMSAASPATVFDVIADLDAHLEWSGNRAAEKTFKLLTLDASDRSAKVGTTFESTGTNFNGTFHDRSVVTEVARPTLFTIETDARLDRRRGKTWEVHFRHRYDIEPEAEGSRITYTETMEQMNYVPYWLKPVIRSVFKPLVNSADRKQLGNLARLAEERRTGHGETT